MTFASSHGLFRDILHEFAERAAWAIDDGYTLAAVFERQRIARNTAVSECIARKQAKGCPKLAASRRRASAAFYARKKAARVPS